MKILHPEWDAKDNIIFKTIRNEDYISNQHFEYLIRLGHEWKA